MNLPFLGFGSEQALRAMADALPDGVFTTDLDGRVTHWNASAERITGWSREEALGRSCSILAGDAVHGCSCGAGPLRCGLASSGRASKCCTARAKDGRMILIVKNAVPLYSASGEVAGALESFTDVTSYAASQLRPPPAPPPGADFHGLVGRDGAMLELYELVGLVARSDATVLVVGESGTGKERVAEAIHALSPRSAGPFVRVPCSTLDDLLECGSGPGAAGGDARPGRTCLVDEAHGGTLLLDEIADASPAAQLALLRAIEGRRLERRGGHGAGAAEVRLVCTTHHDLKAMIRRGAFRADLYFRVAAFPLRVPALREHPGDLPIITEHLLSRGPDAARGPLSADVLAAISAYPWPGNVRELENALGFAVLRAAGRPIRTEDLPPEVRAAVAVAPSGARAPRSDVGRDAIVAALAETGWKRSEAARRLGISRVTLWKRIKQLGIEGPAS